MPIRLGCWRRSLLRVVAAASLSIVLPFSAPAEPDNHKNPIRIGVSLGRTGIYESITRSPANAYRLWERQVNQRGGILGRPVELTIRDDKSEPATAVKIYEDFIEKEKLNFVFGPYSSPIGAAVAAVADKNGYPTLMGTSAAEEIWQQGYTNIFGVISPASQFAIGFLAILSEAQIDRVAIVTADDIFSLSSAEGARKWAPQYRVRVAAFIVEPKNHADMVRAAEKARESGVQALLLSGHFEEAVQMRRALKQIGWSPAAYFATVGPAVPKYLDELGNDVHGTFFTSLWEPRDDLRYPGSAAFLQAYLAVYGEAPTYQAATVYASAQILEQAILKAGTTERAAVREAMRTLDTTNILGRYAVDRSGAQMKGTPLIVQWQGNKREIVWPLETRTAMPVLNK